MTNEQEIIIEAEKILNNHSYDVELQLTERIEGNYFILRCRSDGFKENSVIIKKYITEKKDEDLDNDANTRFLCELLGLIYLNEISKTQFYPRMFAYDQNSRIIILEDFGNLETIMDELFKPNLLHLKEDLIAYAKCLGNLHGSARGHIAEFQDLQTKFEVTSPMSDSNMSHLPYWEVYEDLLKNGMGLMDISSHKNSIELMEKYFQDNQTIIHCDTGFQNFLYILDESKAILLDYEYIAIGNPLLDFIGIYLGSPQSYKGLPIPQEFLKLMELEYFDVLQSYGWDFSQSEREYAMIAALNHWVRGRIFFFWRRFLKDYMQFKDSEEFEMPENIDHMVMKMKTLCNEFLKFPYTNSHYELQKEVVIWLKVWLEQIPVEKKLEEIYFPCFNGTQF